MEQNAELMIVRPPVLNEYCLLEIFKFLNLDDAISFGDCCRYVRMVADCVFKRYSRFQLSSIGFDKSERYVNKVISRIGAHILSLEVDFIYSDWDLSKILELIGDNCSNLKCLEFINNYYEGPIRKFVRRVDTAYNFETVESLELVRFDSRSAIGFLHGFRHLKHLRVAKCFISAAEAKALIHNNPNIETFSSEDVYGKPQFFHRLPPSIALNFLTKMRIDCNAKKINHFLRRLAKWGIMEEMKLIDVDVDGEFFDILRLFGKIRLLEIGYDHKERHELLYARRGYKKLKSTIIWPNTLRSLRLMYFEFTLDAFIEIVRQLGRLESLELADSIIAESDSIYFTHIDIFPINTQPLIVLAVYNSNGMQCRQITLPFISMRLSVYHADNHNFVECYYRYYDRKYYPVNITNITRYLMV